jgi:hypothetical protein
MQATIEKLDLAKADPAYYKAGQQPKLVDLDAYYYLSHEGAGSPSEKVFEQAIERLYAVAYQIKFLCKAQDMDFVVPKMEGQWWIDGGPDVQHLFATKPESEWLWKIMLRMPDFVEADHFYRAVQLVKKKKPDVLDDQVKLQLSQATKAVQVLHLGSYHDEQPTIAKAIQFIQSNGLQINAYHKEIYLSDPRKTSEEKLRTIIRYGVE